MSPFQGSFLADVLLTFVQMLKDNINPFLFFAGLLVGIGFMFFLAKMMNRPCDEEAEQFQLRSEILSKQVQVMEEQMRFQDSIILNFQQILLDTSASSDK